jgi:hypothetical protein
MRPEGGVKTIRSEEMYWGQFGEVGLEMIRCGERKMNS